MVVLLLALLVAAPALGETENRPFWTEQAMFRFGEDLFFVGRASCAKTVEDGLDQAFRRGLKEILNYAQAASTSGLPIETQMVFHERDSAGCPTGTITVWRLLRVEADELAALPKGIPPLIPGAPAPPPPSPRDLTPRPGMTHDEVWNRFGQPRSIVLKGREAQWEYPQFGLTLILDREEGLTSWKLSGPQGREVGLAPKARPRPPAAAGTEPPIDLTGRLLELEEEAQRAREPEGDRRPLSQIERDRGREIFNGKGACARCHGINGDPARVDPLLVGQLTPRPPDLRRTKDRKHKTFEDWVRVIKQGIPGTSMLPVTHLQDEEIFALAHYLRHLQGPEHLRAGEAKPPAAPK